MHIQRRSGLRIFSVTQKPIYFPSIKRIWASKAGKEPKRINVTGSKIHCKNTEAFLNLFMPFGTGGKSNVLKTAETSMPTIEIVIILPVKIGRLKDRTVKLNFTPPNNIGSHPKAKSKSAAVAHDQNPSKIVYKCETLLKKGIFLFFKKPNII